MVRVQKVLSFPPCGNSKHSVAAMVPTQWRRFPSHSNPRHHHSRFRLRRILPVLLLLAFFPPIFFHFRLTKHHQARSMKCGWLSHPPLVCAHGGDSSLAVPNTMDAYHSAIRSRVDCMEIDVSRSSDGVLFALHDRDLQRMSGNSTSEVGFFNRKEIEELDASYQFPLNIQKQDVPTIEDALSLVSNSVRVVILDAKVGPPLYEKWLAEDIISVVRKTNCRNCIVWAKSDNLARDLIKASQDILVGYIVMNDPSAGVRSKLLRMKGASVVGVYHPLIDEKLVGTLRRRNKKVYAWTVDDEESMRRMLYERVDAIVTGKPSYLQVLMENVKTECMEEGFTVL